MGEANPPFPSCTPTPLPYASYRPTGNDKASMGGSIRSQPLCDLFSHCPARAVLSLPLLQIYMDLLMWGSDIASGIFSREIS